MAGSPWALQISSSLFSLRSGHPDFIFSFLNCRITWRGEEAQNQGDNNKLISSPFDQKCPLSVKVLSQISTFSILHTNAHDRLDDISTHHKPHFPQITGVLEPSHNMVRSTEERFATVRMATRGFGAKNIIGRPCCAMAGLCFMSCCMFRLTSLGVSCVALVCGSMAVMRSAFVRSAHQRLDFR